MKKSAWIVIATITILLLTCTMCTTMTMAGYLLGNFRPIFAAAKPKATTATVAPAALTNTLDVNVLQSWISQTSGEELPGSLINYIGAFCDTTPSACVWSQLGNWNVTGPAVIVTDPIGDSMTSFGWSIIKTYQMVDGRWGVYYCPSTCKSPKPGRAALLSAPLP